MVSNVWEYLININKICRITEPFTTLFFSSAESLCSTQSYPSLYGYSFYVILPDISMSRVSLTLRNAAINIFVYIYSYSEMFSRSEIVTSESMCFLNLGRVTYDSVFSLPFWKGSSL